MKKRLIAIALAMLLVIGTVLPAAAAGFDNSVLESVVVILSQYDYQGYRCSSIGTGFFIGAEGAAPQYLVTNCHVVQDYIATGKSSGGGALAVLFDASDYEEAYIVDYDAEMDLALLRLGSATDKRKPLKLRLPENDLVGDTVYAVGYPGTSEYVGAISSYGAQDATVTDGTVSRLVTQSGTGRRVLQTTAVIHGGSSGGPLVDTNGAVLGINTLHYIDEEGNQIEGSNYAISVEELLPLLERNKVQYELWEPESSGTPVGLIAAAAVLLVVLVAIAVLVTVNGNKKKQQEAAQAEQERLAREAAEEEERRRRQAVEEAERMKEQQKSSPAVRSMAVQHQGMRIPVDSSPILLGRNVATCKLVYRQNTPGVSKEHCELSWNAQSGEFVLTDLSTYGTYLLNGERLEKGRPYRLRPGDGFYLGERANELRVELG